MEYNKLLEKYKELMRFYDAAVQTQKFMGEEINKLQARINKEDYGKKEQNNVRK